MIIRTKTSRPEPERKRSSRRLNNYYNTHGRVYIIVTYLRLFANYMLILDIDLYSMHVRVEWKKNRSYKKTNLWEINKSNSVGLGRRGPAIRLVRFRYEFPSGIRLRLRDDLSSKRPFVVKFVSYTSAGKAGQYRVLL